jgi:Ala-tRNA(Pro) deacylase
MPIQQLKEYLDANNVRYISIEHSIAYTAKEIADRIKIKGDQMAKTVMINLDGVMSMVVLPASCRIRWDRFTRAMGTELVELLTEDEFKDRFPDCEVGAMPPFGSLFGIPTYMFEGFHNESDIAFRAGTHHEVIKMRLSDYVRLEHPMSLAEGFAKVGVKRPEWLRRKTA